MIEKHQPASPENNFNGRLSEGMLTMMNFEAAILSHTTPQNENDFNPNEAIQFAREVTKKSDLFDTLSTDRNFHPAAAYPNTTPLIKVGLLTAPHIVMQDLKDGNKGNFASDFSEYNRAIRGAIQANPNMSKTALIHILKGATLWAKLPKALYNKETAAMLEGVINGASSECVAYQLLASSWHGMLA